VLAFVLVHIIIFMHTCPDNYIHSYFDTHFHFYTDIFIHFYINNYTNLYTDTYTNTYTNLSTSIFLLLSICLFSGGSGVQQLRSRPPHPRWCHPLLLCTSAIQDIPIRNILEEGTYALMHSTSTLTSIVSVYKFVLILSLS
jgi:hypothetical protein